jgi:hypothetical protein
MRGFVIAGLCAALGAACASDEKEVMVPSSQMAPRTTPMDATERIAEARCKQEASCNAIGPGAAFGSKELCMQAMRADAAEELAGTDCMDGVADRYLNACLAEVASSACSAASGSFDRLRSYRACRTASICLG